MTATAAKVVAQRAVKHLDFTSLNDTDTDESIAAFCRKAATSAGNVAAVCCYPRFVPIVKKTFQELGIRDIKVATVANFPGGGDNIEVAVTETKACIAYGADEVDVVFPYKALMAGNEEIGYQLVKACKDITFQSNKILKVILETGELGDPKLIRMASELSLRAGADFLKTSTGKVKINATLEAVEIMLRAINDMGFKANVGIKPAGGIKTTEDAGKYLEMADRIMGKGWANQANFRIGASGVLSNLLKSIFAEAAERALKLVDLTSLNENDTDEKIIRLCEGAITSVGTTAAVCVFPQFVNIARETLKLRGAEGKVKVAAVSNFPGGGDDVQAAVSETSACISYGADEVDVVFPYKALMAGNAEVGKRLVEECKKVTLAAAKKLKVIIEVGELADPKLVYQASVISIKAGADFIKTSTGKVKINATPEAAEIMIQAIKDAGANCGFKAAGGVKTVEDAAKYLEIADRIMGKDWVNTDHFRFGASGLLGNLLETLGHQ